MSSCAIIDEAGSKIPVRLVEGLAYPTTFTNYKFPGEDDYVKHVEDIKNMTIREDDVLLCTFPRSGSSWSREVLDMLTKGKAEYGRDGLRSNNMDINTLAHIDALPSPRLLHTHYPIHLLPKQARDGKCKLVHVLRNPRDVAVSLYLLLKRFVSGYTGTFSDFHQIFQKEADEAVFYPWHRYELEFEKFKEDNPHVAIHTVSYEEMKRDLAAETKRVSEFLGYQYDDKLIADIAEKCTFKNLKQAEAEVKKSLPFKYVPEQYRKGEVGDWKNWFTVTHYEQTEAFYSERLKGSKLKFTYEL